jgi:cytochrome c peroxidase
MLGVRKSAEIGVRAGIRFIQFAVRPEADAVAIDEYLKSLKAMPSPKLVKDPATKKLTLSKAAENGKKLFEKADCAMCHSGPYMTDMSKYNIGTGKPRQEGDDREPEDTFDTPTLIEVWRTAPYLHDGRAATMKDVITEFNKKDKHGKTSDLTEKQIEELVEYILSL